MKALLVAVNAKYIHTSLSVRTLKAYANSDNVEMAEYTINERVEDILRSIFLKKAEDRKSTRLNSSHYQQSRMPSSA